MIILSYIFGHRTSDQLGASTFHKRKEKKRKISEALQSTLFYGVISCPAYRLLHLEKLYLLCCVPSAVHHSSSIWDRRMYFKRLKAYLYLSLCPLRVFFNSVHCYNTLRQRRKDVPDTQFLLMLSYSSRWKFSNTLIKFHWSLYASHTKRYTSRLLTAIQFWQPHFLPFTFIIHLDSYATSVSDILISPHRG